MSRATVAVPLLIAFVAACTGPAITVSPARSPSPSAPSAPPGPISVPSPTPVAAGCPPAAPDPDAVLPAEFSGEYLPEPYTKAVVAEFLDALASLYENPQAVDSCAWFTDAGWAAALTVDWRLRGVVDGEVRIRQEHELRLASELVNDPRSDPPRLTVDAIFDIAPGAAVVDAATRAVRERSTGVQRTGLLLAFVYDGERWRVDDVGEVSPDAAAWARLPEPPAPGVPCDEFVADDPGPRPFDDDADRVWCDGDGRGRKVTRDVQLELITRYPCDRGHAAILFLGRPLGARLDPLVRWEYVRDPAGEFLVNRWLVEPYVGDATLPPAAVYTGWTNGNVELWTADDELDRAVYLVRGDVVERWPRAADGWGVIDCN